jgi:hypothetical protein
MDFSDPITLAVPAVQLRWSVSENQLVEILAPASPVRIVPGQIKAECTLIEGLSGECRFHFDASNRLRMLQLKRRVPRHRQSGFNAWNERLMVWLSLSAASKVYSSNWHEWLLGRIAVTHIQHHDGVEKVELIRR